ncbi:MAG: hypothetical protein KGL39_31540 [Patescibacteria group bacterium]|nr:hypothetical protein [Patescibacteria group bacterium]
MGFGGQFSATNKLNASVNEGQNVLASQAASLNDFSNAENTLGSQMEQQAAQQQSAALQQQATLTVQQGALMQEQQQREINLTVGNQEEAYATGGVEMQGTPLATITDTVQQGQLEINAIGQQASNQAQLLRTQASLYEQQGLADVIGAQGQNFTNTANMVMQQEQMHLNQDAQTAQLKIQEQAQKQQQLMGFLGMGLSLGASVLRGR